MWDGLEYLNKIFQTRKVLFHTAFASQGYINEILWNCTSEKTVSGVISTLLKIYPLPEEQGHGHHGFNSFYPFCSEIVSLDGHISMEYHLAWVSLASW